MAIRQIRQDGDEVLRKKAKEVKEITPKTIELIEDMLDTMYESQGVGLAAPQVGILKRIVVIDIGEGPIILINPVIVEAEGSQVGEEGCLSVLGRKGIVDRPSRVKVRALNEDGEEVEYEGIELLARAFCHELEHLDGILYIDKMIEEVFDDE